MKLMSEQNKANRPYEVLGKKLKTLRSRRKESLVEVSGAVEIDSDVLSRYEQGVDKPSEDILALLISYFGVREDEANGIWELAGYSPDDVGEGNFAGTNDQAQVSPQILVMPMDARVIYTDLVHVMVNNYGVVVNFMQNGGPNNQPLAVSRIGMSKEHARSLLDVLKSTLEQAENPPPPRQLPDTASNNETSKK